MTSEPANQVWPGRWIVTGEMVLCPGRVLANVGSHEGNPRGAAVFTADYEVSNRPDLAVISSLNTMVMAPRSGIGLGDG